jgi:hypothetical protein
MPKQTRLYVVTVFEGEKELIKSPIPAPTAAKARSDFLKAHKYFKDEKYKLTAKIAAVKGLPHWKIVLEETALAKKGEKKGEATDDS